jgi:hypothetical protein
MAKRSASMVGLPRPDDMVVDQLDDLSLDESWGMLNNVHDIIASSLLSSPPTHYTLVCEQSPEGHSSQAPTQMLPAYDGTMREHKMPDFISFSVESYGRIAKTKCRMMAMHDELPVLSPNWNAPDNTGKVCVLCVVSYVCADPLCLRDDDDGFEESLADAQSREEEEEEETASTEEGVPAEAQKAYEGIKEAIDDSEREEWNRVVRDAEDRKERLNAIDDDNDDFILFEERHKIFMENEAMDEMRRKAEAAGACREKAEMMITILNQRENLRNLCIHTASKLERTLMGDLSDMHDIMNVELGYLSEIAEEQLRLSKLNAEFKAMFLAD